MLRDDFGGNWFQFHAALNVLADARADRRIAVLGAVSDFGITGRQNWRELGAKAAAAADAAVFVGKDAGAARSAAVAAGMPSEQAFSFTNLRPAAEFLRSELQMGDLVLLKGGRATEHITRLFFSQTGSIDCWVRKCKKPILCDFCHDMGYRPDNGIAGQPPLVRIK
jgi:UDP-N-acetylmuramoyl-tripeptide--D-alanyl-D-alanine ligase